MQYASGILLPPVQKLVASLLIIDSRTGHVTDFNYTQIVRGRFHDFPGAVRRTVDGKLSHSVHRSGWRLLTDNRFPYGSHHRFQPHPNRPQKIPQIYCICSVCAYFTIKIFEFQTKALLNFEKFPAIIYLKQLIS